MGEAGSCACTVRRVGAYMVGRLLRRDRAGRKAGKVVLVACDQHAVAAPVQELGELDIVRHEHVAAVGGAVVLVDETPPLGCQDRLA